jgi:hypothetical protein
MRRAAPKSSARGTAATFALLAGLTAFAAHAGEETPPTAADEPSADVAPDPAESDEPPPRAPHPEPRVIVEVQRVLGPHDRGAVERAARLGWGRIVACHKAASARGVQARGTIRVRLEVSPHGVVKHAARVRSELEGELSKCLVRAMRGLTMPSAKRGSTIEASIRVAPGDRG